MAKKDTVEKQPVDKIEDEIASLIEAADEKVEDENESKEAEDENEEPEVSEPGDAEDEPVEVESDEDNDETREDDVEGDTDGEPDTGAESADEPGDGDTPELPLEAPEHWAAGDRELFNNQPREAQEFILERHKSMEGDYTRKSQETAAIKRRDDAVTDALAPYTAEFQQAGLDHAGAVRQLASWHDSLRTGGKAALLQLANMYNIDMSETEDQFVDPTVKTLQNEVSQLRADSTRRTNEAQQDKQNQLLAVIQQFENETSDTGALKHPHFKTLQDDITRLFSSGIATDLPDAYAKALTFRPDLTVRKEPAKTVSKVDQASKVKKAKKAATGVKSSGASSKVNRGEMSLEQDIASQIPD